jgi:TolB-like protein
MAEGGNERASGGTAPVFISYASHDAACAEAIVAGLERQGLKCWIAPRDVTPGASYAGQIIHAIDAAQASVLILSKYAAASPHVLREVERAASKRHPIISLRVDQAPLPADFEYFLNTSHWLDTSASDVGPALPRLVAAIQAALEAPAGIPVDAPAAHSAPAVSARLPHRIAIVLASAVGLGLVVFAADRLWLSSSRAAATPAATPAASALASATAALTISEKSIAVLPFTDMSEKKDQEYFADGMAEEVLDLLARIPSIKVIARTSSFQFKGKSTDLRLVGNSLGAAYVVEGTVRKSGEQLRVTAQLIGTKDGSHVWSETYDETFGEVLAIQDRIAASIVRALQVTIGADDLPSRPILKNAEAYDLYLRGRHAMDRFDKAGFESAAGYFQQALELDPSSIRAAEWLAVAHEFLAEWGFVPVREGYGRARASVERALQIDPNSGLAHSILCTIEAVYDWNAPAALEECRRALAFEPRNPQVLLYAGQMEDVVGQWDEATHLLSEGVALDPLFAGFHVLLAIADEQTGRLAEAEARRRWTLKISPSFVRGHYELGTTLLAEGKVEAALGEMRQETADGGRDAGLAMAYYAMGRKADSDAALTRLIRERGADMASWIAEVHAYRGDHDQAFTWLDRAYRQKDVNLWLFKTSLAFNKLESDPRYKAFLKKMNLPE